jgi:hypothetical protein
MSSCRSLALRRILLTVLLGAALAAAPYLQSTAAETPLVHAVDRNLTSGAPGPTVVLPVQVTNVQGLGAATVLVDYDPASTSWPKST